MPQDNRHDIRLETERLILRRTVSADAVRVRELADDYDISKNLGRMPYPLRLADVETFLQRIDESWGLDMYTFAICLKDEDARLIGMGGALNFQARQAELGYWLGKPYWGRKLMSEAVMALLAFVFERVNAPFVLADHFLDNPASGRVLEKCGFREIETRSLYSCARGQFSPARFLTIEQTDWLNARNRT